MIETIEQAFEILENQYEGIPFEAIQFLYDHEPNEKILDKVIFHLTNAYNLEIYKIESSKYLLSTPLWFSIIAEKHHDERVIDPVINLFTTTEDDWDFLNEQGQYLIGLLSEKYPDIVVPRVLEEIENLSNNNSELPYLYLFDSLYFADIEKYKDEILKIVSKDDFIWYDSFIGIVSDIQIKEAIPILKSKLEDSKDKVDYKFGGLYLGDLESALEQLETGIIKYPDQAKAVYKMRTNWYDYYISLNDRFTSQSEIEDDDFGMDDYIEINEPIIKLNKIGRNDKCPCGSGKKYKKCCLDKGIYE